MLRPLTRSRAVVLAVWIQLLTALSFVLSIIVVWTSGADAQAAAEAELARQGLPASLLAEHGVSFGSNTAETPLPAAIITVLVVLARLNLTGRRAGQVLSWVFHPLLAVAGALIVPAQLFTATFLATSFRDSGDPVLRQVDVPKLVDAAREAMPSWLPVVDGAKLVLTTAGSLLVIVLLALPASRAFFRGRKRINPTSKSESTA
ncbi:hypothetical protein [Amycolatopsis tolypomycina]|uniref:Uncharacterized protein n=1 Tax=Amycolatopsis tolypomycina TaxID=208445 RepID=A0A1H4Y718_9PSEU|nr:hypothetical protein [Amycolatopsis tolypomycina]SED13776.1 hypothetical protein SAMN04489727_6580 [Amycolatopsis tolypomycina]